MSRSLLTFDTSTFEGRSVTDARVELYAGGKLAAGCFPGQTIKAQRVTSSWEWATWSNPPATTSVGEVIATEPASALDLAPGYPFGNVDLEGH